MNNKNIEMETSKKYYQIALDSTNLMLYLVRDIMDFSQIEAKSFILNITECRIMKALEECIGMFILKAQEKNIKLSLDHSSLASCLPEILLIDENRLKQVIINLVSNAIKYTIEGEVKIMGSIDRRRKVMLIVVEDTGVGMSEK
jgi:signal transduction histidine kinase